MGIVVVLLFYAVALTIAAAVSSVLLVTGTAVLTRKLPMGRKRLISTATLFPFACVAFAGCWFVAYASINSTVFHRDPGLGDGWQTPLPNGYSIGFIDTTDQGTVFRGDDLSAVLTRPDTLSGVRQLQVADHYLLGATDSGYFDRLGKESTFVDGYFLLDSESGAVSKMKSLDELRLQANAHHVALRLLPIADVYSHYQLTWFDYSALLGRIYI